MSELQEASVWYAEQCGVRITSTGYMFDISADEEQIEWTIEDARCREICREKFQLSTLKLDDDRKGEWGVGDVQTRLVGYGNTIPEAEIACLLAIYDGRE